MGAYMLPLRVKVNIEEYLDDTGKSPFNRWFIKLKAEVAALVVVAIYRMEQGNFARVKSVGGGVFECKVNVGPGIRIYFGQVKDVLIILLGGGFKKQQSKDILLAKKRWKDYKNRKERGQVVCHYQKHLN